MPLHLHFLTILILESWEVVKCLKWPECKQTEQQLGPSLALGHKLNPFRFMCFIHLAKRLMFQRWRPNLKATGWKWCRSFEAEIFLLVDEATAASSCSAAPVTASSAPPSLDAHTADWRWNRLEVRMKIPSFFFIGKSRWMSGIGRLSSEWTSCILGKEKTPKKSSPTRFSAGFYQHYRLFLKTISPNDERWWRERAARPAIPVHPDTFNNLSRKSHPRKNTARHKHHPQLETEKIWEVLKTSKKIPLRFCSERFWLADKNLWLRTVLLMLRLTSVHVFFMQCFIFSTPTHTSYWLHLQNKGTKL